MFDTLYGTSGCFNLYLYDLGEKSMSKVFIVSLVRKANCETIYKTNPCVVFDTLYGTTWMF